MQRLQVEKTWRACYASKVQGQSRANIHYRRMKCNELPCSVVGSLKKGRRAKHLNCERNCQWNPVGHVQKARGMEACFVISHGTAPDSRRLQAKLEAFKLLWTCFKYALYVWSIRICFWMKTCYIFYRFRWLRVVLWIFLCFILAPYWSVEWARFMW